MFLAQSRSTQDEMGVMITKYNSSPLYWAIGLLVLGALVTTASFLSISSLGNSRMSMVGYAMVGFGVIMFFVGYWMFSGIAPLMAGPSLSSGGMLIVGTLMLLNGILMATRSM
jgi:hypothetical protein